MSITWVRLIGVTCAMSVGSVQEKASRPSRVRTVSMSDRSSVIWTTLAVVVLGTRGSSVNVRPRACGGPAAQTRRQTAHGRVRRRSEEHTSELQSRLHLVCRLLLEKKKKKEEQSE